MCKLLLYFLLIAALLSSPFLPQYETVPLSIRLLAMVVASIIMIDLGCQFEVYERGLRQSLWDKSGHGCEWRSHGASACCTSSI